MGDHTELVSHNEDVFKEEKRVKREEDRNNIVAIDLLKSYGMESPAVKGVTFGVRENEIFGLLGPNGAGKSSTFNMLTMTLR